MDFEKEIDDLKKEIESLKNEPKGGIISSSFIRKLVISEKSDVDKLKNYFENREWDNIDQFKINGKHRFIIYPYNPLNLTPFSYDLAVGNEIYSSKCMKPVKFEEDVHKVMPGEMIIVISDEYIALPPSYAATIWPRFNLVKRGMFQSMVKIDPTWYGKLAVAMTNILPVNIKIKKGEKFGTLLFYELSQATDINLWKYKDLLDRGIKTNIGIDKSKLSQNIVDEIWKEWKGKRVYIEGNFLIIIGIKYEDFVKLSKIDQTEYWQGIIKDACNKWVEKNSVVMEALGMDQLDQIVEGVKEDIEIPKIEEIKKTECSEKALEDIALEYGKPFDVISKIPEFIKDKLIDQKIDSKFGTDIIPKVFTFIVSTFGLLSLIVAILVFIVKLETFKEIKMEEIYKYSLWIFIFLAVSVVFGLASIKKFWNLPDRIWKAVKNGVKSIYNIIIRVFQ